MSTAQAIKLEVFQGFGQFVIEEIAKAEVDNLISSDWQFDVNKVDEEQLHVAISWNQLKFRSHCLLESQLQKRFTEWVMEYMKVPVQPEGELVPGSLYPGIYYHSHSTYNPDKTCDQKLVFSYAMLTAVPKGHATHLPSSGL